MKTDDTRVGAAAMLVSGERILLGRRSPNKKLYPGVWDLVGGHCQLGESPAAALVREVREEVGVIPIEFMELTVLPEPDVSAYGPAEYHIFRVTKWLGGTPRLIGREHDRLKWVTPTESRTMALAHPDYQKLFETTVGCS